MIALNMSKLVAMFGISWLLELTSFVCLLGLSSYNLEKSWAWKVFHFLLIFWGALLVLWPLLVAFYIMHL